METSCSFSIPSVFSKASFVELSKYPNGEDLQRSRTGSLELGTNREPKLKTSVSEYDMRGSKEREEKESLNEMKQLHSGHDFRETLGSRSLKSSKSKFVFSHCRLSMFLFAKLQKSDVLLGMFEKITQTFRTRKREEPEDLNEEEVSILIFFLQDYFT